jgi:hypothetical protein
VQLTIRDGAGRTVADVQETATAGLNRYVWSLSPGGGQQQGGGQGGFGRARRVDPGLYRVQVRAGAATADGIVQVSR